MVSLLYEMQLQVLVYITRLLILFGVSTYMKQFIIQGRCMDGLFPLARNIPILKQWHGQIGLYRNADDVCIRRSNRFMPKVKLHLA